MGARPVVVRAGHGFGVHESEDKTTTKRAQL